MLSISTHIGTTDQRVWMCPGWVAVMGDAADHHHGRARAAHQLQKITYVLGFLCNYLDLWKRLFGAVRCLAIEHPRLPTLRIITKPTESDHQGGAKIFCNLCWWEAGCSRMTMDGLQSAAVFVSSKRLSYSFVIVDRYCFDA